VGNRSIERAHAKAQYTKFAKAWRNEKRYQKMIEESLAKAKDGDQVHMPAGVPLESKLGRRPTFAQWLAAVKSADARQNPSPEVVQEHINDVQDLDWKDE